MKKQPARRAATSRSPVSTSLHRAKLRRPETAEHYIRRSRLFDLFDGVPSNQLTLVVSPAGTGKTSLVAGWVAESPAPSAWLSLDDTDADGAQFWSSVISAVATLAPGCGDRALTMLRRPATRAAAVDQLVADLAAEDLPPAVLVIDDFHVVDVDAFVVESVSGFVQNLPGWLRVVLMSRREPRLPIARMRSRGQLGEIHLAELRFSRDEAVELMTRLSPALSSEHIEAAVQRADGWAASLQLTALAARSRQAQTLTPGPGAEDDVLIQDYVLHEVLANEAAEVLDVLYAAAVVPRVNPSLAQKLTDHLDAGGLLRAAEARGLFVTRRSASGWVELHELVRSVLVVDLASRSPGRLTELHTRAARWLESAGEVVLALDQWLLADRPRDVLRLLAASHGDLYDSGREATVRRTIAAIPATVAVNDLESMVSYAWCHLLVDRRRFVELVEQLTWWADRASPNDTVRTHVDVLRASAALVNGRWVESGTLNRQVMADLGDTGWQDPLGRFAANGVAHELALSERWDDTSDEVRQTEAALSRDRGTSLGVRGNSGVGGGVGRPAAGRDPRVRRRPSRRPGGRHDRHAHRAEPRRGAGAPGARRSFPGLGRAHRHRRHTRRNDAVLSHPGHVRARPGSPRGRRTGHSTAGLRKGRVTRHGGVARGRRAWLADPGRDAARRGRGRPRVRPPLGGSGRRFLLGCSQHSTSGSRLRRPPRSGDVARHGRATLRPSRGHPGPPPGTCGRRPRGGDEVRRRCRRDGLGRRLVADGGVRGRRGHRLGRAGGVARPEEWLDRLRRLTAETSSLEAPAGPEMIEPLTDRERDVLRFLPSRLTVREIADELYVSVNTLKFHLRVIYRKLGVNSRAEAAEMARTMTKVRR